jgi:hypothetical protein
MMQSAEEHQDIVSEVAAIMPVKGLKKWRRGRKLIAERHGEPKKLNRGSCGSRKKLAAACRKVSHPAAVVWQKRNLIRQIWTEVNCGPRSTLATDGKMTSHHAKVAWLKENFVRKDCARNKAEQATPKPQKDGKRLWKGQEFKDGLRDRGLKRQQWQLRGKAGIKEHQTRRQLRLRIKRTSNKIDGKTFRLEMVKRANETSSWLRRIRIWRVWKDRLPPKCKKRLRKE